ncbi:hypothetical protein BV898_03954 [Hypsibius exemplaris]|uniref:Uncharacterized protein n=1 Tax=Hypsibius exemplaris TaxID=2072580 RepID=A0A1W0X3N3_HYPEX|nr:hypothetical protein BV898_03954 [Hypsibius exemplaris]
MAPSSPTTEIVAAVSMAVVGSSEITAPPTAITPLPIIPLMKSSTPPHPRPLSPRGPEKALGVDGRDETGCFLFGVEDENWYGAWFPNTRQLLPRPQCLPQPHSRFCIWIYRSEILLHDKLRWTGPAELFVDSRKLLVIYNKEVNIMLPILDVRTTVPKARNPLTGKSKRRLSIIAYNQKGHETEGAIPVLHIKLTTTEVQCEVRNIVTAFRALATPKPSTNLPKVPIPALPTR